MTEPRQLAARLREERAAVVADVASGRVSVAASAADPRAATVKVVVLAEAVPGVGKVASRRVLDSLGIGHHQRWGELTTEALDRLVTALVTAGGA